LTRLIRFLRDKIAKQKEILNQAKQELTLVKEYKWEIYHLRKENEHLKNKIRQYQGHP
jgi:cell shape-determining protein MreC